MPARFKSRLKLTLIIIWLVLYNLDAQVNPGPFARVDRSCHFCLGAELRVERGSRLCRAALRPAAKLAEDSDTTTSLFYLIEVLMNGETETASLAQEKKEKSFERHEAWAGWDSGFNRVRSIKTLELLQICIYILSVSGFSFFSHWSAGTGHTNCTNVQICCPLEPESTWY